MPADFRVACGFQHHPKVKQLRRRLGDAAAFSLVCLWGYTAEQGPDGSIRNDPEFIATAAEWSGDPEAFVNALIECGLLDRKGRSLLVHNWAIRNPFAASFEKRSTQAREANRIRWEREHQERMRQPSEPESGSDTVGTISDSGSAPPLPSSSPPIPNPSRKVRSKRSDDTEAEGFKRFYAEYPRHEARTKALKAWHALNPGEELQTRILSDIRHRNQSVWRDKDMQFLPLPASYLNGKRWEDELDATSNHNGALPPTADEYFGGRSS